MIKPSGGSLPRFGSQRQQRAWHGRDQPEKTDCNRDCQNPGKPAAHDHDQLARPQPPNEIGAIAAAMTDGTRTSAASSERVTANPLASTSIDLPPDFWTAKIPKLLI
jgi:hypothetical protein